MSSVCLVIPYYEAGEGLVGTLSSVQLRADDSIIVVDDGSRRLPASEFCPSEVNGTPVRLITCEKNGGITAALLAGFAAIPADASYIARLDCGDFCMPDRFEAQRAYLDTHPDCGVLSSHVEYIDLSGQSLYVDKYPTDPSSIRKRMRVNSAFCHSGSMFRRSLYEATEGYSSNYPAAEDYALFREMLKLTDGANIDRVLIRCTTSDGGISDQNRRRQLLSRLKIMREHFDWHPMSVYGMARTSVQLVTSRKVTTMVKKLLPR